MSWRPCSLSCKANETEKYKQDGVRQSQNFNLGFLNYLTCGKAPPRSKKNIIVVHLIVVQNKIPVKLFLN